MMANGTTDEKIARADRLRDERDRVRREAAQRKQGLANSIANVRRAQLPSYGDEEISEVTVGRDGAHVRAPLPRWARGLLVACLAVGFLILSVAVAWRLTH